MFLRSEFGRLFTLLHICHMQVLVKGRQREQKRLSIATFKKKLLHNCNTKFRHSFILVDPFMIRYSIDYYSFSLFHEQFQ